MVATYLGAAVGATKGSSLSTTFHALAHATRRRSPLVAGVVATVAVGATCLAAAPPGSSDRHAGRAHRPSAQGSENYRISGARAEPYSSTRLWTHNDSGGGTYLYAIGAKGETTATFNLGNASHKDWEGMAQDTSGGVSYLYLGDIGDNGAKRTSIFIHKVREPAVSAAGGTLTPTTYGFKYSDGPHNAEAMMVNPTTHRIYVVTKIRATKGLGAIYAAPTTLSTTKVNVLTKVRQRTVWSVRRGLAGQRVVHPARLRVRLALQVDRLHTDPVPGPAQGRVRGTGLQPELHFVGSEHRYSSIWRVALP